MKTATFTLFATFLNVKLGLLPPGHLFGIMAIAIVLDFATGIIKSIFLGQVRTSSGYRKTVVKFMQYGGSIAVAFILRFLAQRHPELEYSIKYLDWLGNGLLIFIITIELTSIMENVYEVDKTSPISRYLIKPMLGILTFRLRTNPVAEAAQDAKNTKTPPNHEAQP